jgi:hypothetical protein
MRTISAERSWVPRQLSTLQLDVEHRKCREAKVTTPKAFNELEQAGWTARAAAYAESAALITNQAIEPILI